MIKRTVIIQIILLLFVELVFAQSVTVVPSETQICPTEHVQLTASGALYYLWSPSVGLSNVVGHSVIASPSTTTTYTVEGYALSNTELVVNGGFEEGNYGFTSSYQYTTNLLPEGTYYVGENANNYHYAFVGLAHEGTNFMIINGATEPGVNVWTEQVTVVPNTYYAFSTWVCNVGVLNPSAKALLQFSINGVQLGEIFSCIDELSVWEHFYIIWNSGNSNTATIRILNQNTTPVGNDFGLDDISFRELEYMGEAQSVVNVRTSYEPVYYNESACDQYVWHGQTFTTSGQYEHSFTNNNGCDSIFILNLTINSSDTTYLSATSCENYFWDDSVYYQSGIYQKLFNTINACDSIVILDLNIYTSQDIVIHGKPFIFPSTDITSGIYSYFIDSIGINPSNVHWNIDREDWLLVPHGASCDLACTSEGYAILHAWTEGELCDVDTTMGLNATFYGIGENDMQSAVVYPNPTSGQVTITWQDIVAIKVFNLLGQKVDEYKFEKQDLVELDMLNYQESIYVLEIISDRGKSYKQLFLTR